MTAASRLDGAALLEHPITDAIIATIREHGYAEAGVDEFVTRAGISRADFDREFAGKDEAVRRILVAHLDRFVQRVRAVYDRNGDWPANLRAAAYETVRMVREYPDLTWFVAVGVFEADEMARAHRDRILAWAAGLIDEGRAATPDPDAVPPSASLMAVGAIAETLRRQQEGSLEFDLVETVPWLMYSAVRPYLGEEGARAELSIRPPADLRPG